MKNAIYLFAVCIPLLIWSCSSDSQQSSRDTSTPKVEEADEKSAEITQDSSSTSVDSTDTAIAANEVASEDEKEKNSEASTSSAAKEKVVEKPKSTPVADNKPKPSTDTKETPVTTKPVTTPTTKPTPKQEVKTEVKPPKPQPAPKTEPTPTPKPPKSTPKPPSTPAPKEDIKSEPKPQLSHTAWDNLLRKNVSNTGVVDYAAFKRQEASLDIYLGHLEEFPPQDSWSKNKKLAYWFNLYNAWTVKTVIGSYPVNSITDIDGGKTWNVKRAKSGNNTYSLDEVENKIIRPRFKDARIHFAVNCAAKSCPPLLNRAWTASNTESNLEKMTKQFINDSKFNEITANKVKISKIFEWYAVDFGDIISYLNKYSNTQIDSNAKVEYIEYDWALNGK